MVEVKSSPARVAAESAQGEIRSCIDDDKCFLLEAGAGAGKTHSLIESLKYIIGKKGPVLLRRNQKVACITYTNVASDEITRRTDGHSAIYSSTIHTFCWSLIKDLQPHLRGYVPTIESWIEKLEECGGIGNRKVAYDEFGHRSVHDTHVSLHHDDVLGITVKLMEHAKFRTMVSSRYPVIFVDEYQDTDKTIAEALVRHFVEPRKGPLIGFFGDHWQKIYGTGCGKLETGALHIIGLGANFRSAPRIVQTLNQMRPELKQAVNDPHGEGFISIYHSNNWQGARRTGQHWNEDLPAEIAQNYLKILTERLVQDGWDFAPETTKTLMLTHNALARQQGYANLDDVFTRKESYIKKEDPHIAFFVDTLEPVCTAFEKGRFGEMFSYLGEKTSAITSHKDKESWAKNMKDLLAVRDSGTVGEMLDFLKHTKRPRLPESVISRDQQLEQLGPSPAPDESSRMQALRKLRKISYREIIALDRFIDGFTPFSTKHGVKGAEFENVLVVFGRGWSQYNFNEFLEWANEPAAIPAEKLEKFERNRNLFYVACSRPQKRLAVLFTQRLNTKAMHTLTTWFGSTSIFPLQVS